MLTIKNQIKFVRKNPLLILNCYNMLWGKKNTKKIKRDKIIKKNYSFLI